LDEYKIFIFKSERAAQPSTVPVTSAQSTGNMMEGEGTPMFIEMGPEIVSVSSVTAQIVTESENPTTSSSNTGKICNRIWKSYHFYIKYR